MPRSSSLLLTAYLSLAWGGFAGAQVVGDRSESMGGAGLAMPGNVTKNPSQLSLLATYRLPIPLLEYRAYGRDIDQVTSYLARLRRRAPTSISAPYTRRSEEFGGSIGLVYGGLSLSYLARGLEELVPSSGRSDLYGMAYEAYQLSFGQELGHGRGSLAVGVSARVLQASYGHQELISGTAARRPIGSNSQAGFALDLAASYRPIATRDTVYALMISNAVSPQISFDRKLPNGSTEAIQPFRTSLSCGISTRVRDTWIAIDGVDLTNSLGRRQLAMGLSHPLNRYVGLEMGYNSRTSFTVGLSLLGIHARIAGRSPLTIESGIRF
jgi:hypothetical protein